jgi:hypothetical protein
MSDEPKRAQLWKHNTDSRTVEIAAIASLFEQGGVRIVVYRNWPGFEGEPIASHMSWFLDNFTRKPPSAASKWEPLT